VVFLGTLFESVRICKYTPSGQFLGGQAGCYNLIPVWEWIVRCIISIFLVFMISFLPLFLQGTWWLCSFSYYRVLTLIYHRTCWTWNMESHVASDEATLVSVPRFRSFCHPDLHSLDSQQSDFRRRQVHCDWPRVCYNTYLLQHSLLSICWSEHLPGNEDVDNAFVCDTDIMDPILDIFLGFDSLPMYRPVLVQPPPVRLHGFHCWLSVCFLVIHGVYAHCDSSEFLRWMSRGNSRSHNNSWIGYCRLSRTMITGYKKKKLGHPSEKLSGDVPRAGWRAVFWSEIVFPICMAILFVIAYMFVKSIPDTSGNYPPSPLIRIAVISIGPIVWNAAVLLVLFLVSLFLGPMLDPVFPKFGSVIAFVAHALGVVGVIGFFEFLVSSSWPCLPLCQLNCFDTPIVVPWGLENISCGSRTYLCHQHSESDSQDTHLSRPFPRVQAWRNKPCMVDWQMVWPWFGITRNVSACARIHCQNHRAVSLEFGSIARTPAFVHAYASYPHTLFWPFPCHTSLWVLFIFRCLISSFWYLMIVWLRPSKQIRAPLFSINQKRQRRWIVSDVILWSPSSLTSSHRSSNTEYYMLVLPLSSLSSSPSVSVV